MSTLSDVTELLEELHTQVRSASRLTRSELMSVLSRVYSISLSPSEKRELTEYIVRQRRIEGANRAYVFASSGEYILPLRYVFPLQRDRTNVSRYAGALEELRRSQVSTTDFVDAVQSSGGLTELYWRSRNRGSKFQTRSKLNLDNSITIRSDRDVTLRLRPTPGGIFHLLSCEQDKS